jgi:dihydrofolate reductase
MSSAPAHRPLPEHTDEEGTTMTKLRLDISMSLDGYAAGPDASMEDPLGVGGMRLHEWVFPLKSFRENHGETGGEVNADDEVVAEGLARNGAVIMGRNMFSGGFGPGAWEDDANADGWWGDDPPFGIPVFVLTHHARETKPMQGGTDFVFVSDGIESALEQARAAAGDRDVLLAGGADVAQQYLRAGLLDEIQLHVSPLFLGGGRRLFDGIPDSVALEAEKVVASPSVTHLRFRVVR